jgi:sugar (pentulose or hexulose) kinase
MVLSAKDYLYWWLTGDARTEPSTAAGYGVYGLKTKAWEDDLAAVWGLAPGQLPALSLDGDAPARCLLPDRAGTLGLEPDLPVHIGAADSVAAVLGTGSICEGTLVLVPGSSTVVLATTALPRLDRKQRYLVTPHALTDWYGLEMDLLATGAGVSWLSRLTGKEEDSLMAAAADVPPGAGGVTFAPYLAGAEQGALWLDGLAGAVSGLLLEHGPAELTRAFLEGVAFELRRCVGVLVDSGWRFGEVIVAGGDVSGRPIMEGVLADVLGRPARRLALDSAAAFGAAVLTGATALSPADAPAIRDVSARLVADVEPDADRAAAYDTLYEAHVRSFPGRARHRPRPSPAAP